MCYLCPPMAKSQRPRRGGPPSPDRRAPRSASRRKRERRREQQRLQAAPPSRFGWRVLAAGGGAAVLVVVLLVVLLTRGHGSSSTSTSTTSPTPRPTPTPAPTPTPSALASLSTAASGAPVGGIQCQPNEPPANQNSAHLALYVDGAARQIPAGIGIGPPRTTTQTSAGPFVSGACYYALLTRLGDGIIHVEPPTATPTPSPAASPGTTPGATPGATTYTLGQFFDLWGLPLTTSQVGPATGPVTVFVDGTQFAGDPRTVPLSAHAKIQIDVGTVVPFTPYTFPAGD